MRFLTAAKRHLGLGGPTWANWLTLIAGALAEPITRVRTFERLTGRNPPAAPCRELWLAIGRRGGKDYVAVRLAIYLALFRSWTLAPGEVGVVLLLAVDRAQAKVAFNYLRGALEADPALWAEVASITSDCIVLRSGVEIQVGTSDYASVRGRTLLAVLCDEFAFWPHEQAIEILRAIRPGMATQPAAMLIVISSAYSQRGPFYDAFRKYHGVDDPHVVFARATTRDMNPTVPEDYIAGELERDPVAAAAEYLSEFRGDLEGYIDAGLLDHATRANPRELPYLAMHATVGPISYFAGIDVSGGRGDAAAAAIACRHAGRPDDVIVCATRRWPAPHDPLQVAHEVAAFIKSYGLSHGIADQYAAEFATASYREAGIALAASEVTRSEAYLHVLPLFTTGRIEIPDEPTLRQELLALERRTGRSGRDAVDHPPRGHDDLANAVALAAYAASRPGVSMTAEEFIAATYMEPLTVLDNFFNRG